MGLRFNPPPNWPAPPPRWTPPPGWQPDPSWPPPPPGWSLWLPEEDDTTRPAPIRLVLQNGRRWFGARPGWAKVLLVLLAIGLLPWLLIIGGLVAAAVAIIGLLRGSVRRLGVASRAAAALTLVAALASITAGTALAAALTSAPAPQPSATPTLAAPTTSTTPVTTSATPVTTSATPAPPPGAPRTTTHPPGSAPRSAGTPARRTTTAAPPTRPSPPPTTTRPPATLCGAPPNPYGYNFCGRGGLVFDPPTDICSYFNCIGNFWNGVGHMEECQDQSYSMSGGRRGSCSYHGGNLRPVYSGP